MVFIKTEYTNFNLINELYQLDKTKFILLTGNRIRRPNSSAKVHPTLQISTAYE